MSTNFSIKRQIFVFFLLRLTMLVGREQNSLWREEGPKKFTVFRGENIT